MFSCIQVICEISNTSGSITPSKGTMTISKSIFVCLPAIYIQISRLELLILSLFAANRENCQTISRFKCLKYIFVRSRICLATIGAAVNIRKYFEYKAASFKESLEVIFLLSLSLAQHPRCFKFDRGVAGVTLLRIF